MEELHKACKHSLPHPGTTIQAWPLKDCGRDSLSCLSCRHVKINILTSNTEEGGGKYLFSIAETDP